MYLCVLESRKPYIYIGITHKKTHEEAILYFNSIGLKWFIDYPIIKVKQFIKIKLDHIKHPTKEGTTLQLYNIILQYTTIYISKYTFVYVNSDIIDQETYILKNYEDYCYTCNTFLHNTSTCIHNTPQEHHIIEDASKEASKYQCKEASKDPCKEASKYQCKEASKDQCKEASKDPCKEASKEPCKEASKDQCKETSIPILQHTPDKTKLFSSHHFSYDEVNVEMFSSYHI